MKHKADQIKQFRKAARELGCDENEGRFKEALRVVARQKPSPQPKRPATKNPAHHDKDHDG
jgi:hypothetical protein